MRSVVRILGSARQLWPYYLGIIASSLLVTGAGLVTPFILKAATDHLVAITGGTPADLRLLIWLAVALLVVEAGASVITNVGGYLGDVLATRLRALLSTRYFDKLLRLPQRYFDDELTGTIVGRLSRTISELSQFFNMFANTMLPMLLSMVASVAILAWYSWPIALLVVLMYPLFGWLTTISSKRWQQLEKEKNESVDMANGRFAEVVGQVRVVKSFVAEVRELASFGALYYRTISITGEQSTGWHRMDTIRRVALNVIFFGIYVLIFWRTATGAFTVGTMVLLIQIVTTARQPVTGMSWLVDSTQRALAGSRDYFAVMDAPVETERVPELTDAPWAGVATAPAVSFRDVTFGYDDGVPVLSDVSFDVAPGERVAFVGESGGGKTTIVSLLLKLYQPSAGQVLVDGVDLAGVDLAQVRSRIGVVFQEPALFSGTVKENLAYARPDAADETLRTAARRANALTFIESLKDGFQTTIGERGVKLSGGQKQRLAVGRAMVKDAPILVLDEATSALDTKAERQVQAGLEELMEGRTTLVIAHRLSTISSVDRIITLRGGRVDEIGTPAELARSGGIYSELLALQESGSKADRKRLAAYDMVG